MDRKWKKFKKEAGNCTVCSDLGLLEKDAFPLFIKEPPKNVAVLFIAEAPNREDTYNQSKGYLTYLEPTDPTGNNFTELYYNVLNFNHEQLFITNSVLCLPARRNGKYPVYAKQRNYCSIHLRNLIDSFKPKIVCTIGCKALNAVHKIQKHSHNTLSKCVAKQYEWYGRKLFPLYHTGNQAKKHRTGEQQVQDWHELRKLYERVTG